MDHGNTPPTLPTIPENDETVEPEYSTESNEPEEAATSQQTTTMPMPTTPTMATPVQETWRST